MTCPRKARTYANVKRWNDGIDSMARVNLTREIFAALPGIWTKKRDEELLAPKTPCTPAQHGCHLNDPAVGVNGDHGDDTAVWEEDMFERTVSVDQELFALTADVLQLWHELLEVAGRQGEQKAVARPRRSCIHIG
jgi:hypothetical protein